MEAFRLGQLFAVLLLKIAIGQLGTRLAQHIAFVEDGFDFESRLAFS